MKIILASSSPARKKIMARLQLPFTVIKPNIDESALPNESVTDQVARLSVIKAQKVARSLKDTDALVIGCDQLLTCQNQILGKPLTHEKAVEQLSLCSGQRVISYTGLTVLNMKTQKSDTIVERFDIIFRELTPEMIESYLQKEKPYFCAGSVHGEGLGAILFERFEGDDPNALTGLPLIRLARLLEKQGVQLI